MLQQHTQAAAEPLRVWGVCSGGRPPDLPQCLGVFREGFSVSGFV